MMVSPFLAFTLMKSIVYDVTPIQIHILVVKVNSILRWFFPLFSTHTYEINFYDVTPIQIHAKYELNNEKQSIYNKTALIDNFISHNHAVLNLVIS